MLKWLQHRLRKKNKSSTSVYGSEGNSINDDDKDKVEVATEAVQGETQVNNDIGSKKEDTTHMLKVNPPGPKGKGFTQVSHKLEVSSESSFASATDEDTNAYSEPCGILPESQNPLENLLICKTDREVNPQQDKLPYSSSERLSETKGNDIIPETENRKIISGILGHDSSSREECLEGNQTIQQTIDNEILSEPQNTEYPLIAAQNIEAAPRDQEYVHVEQEEISHPNVEVNCTEDGEWENGICSQEKSKDILDNGNLQWNSTSDSASPEISKHFSEVSGSNKSLSVNHGKKEVLICKQENENEGSSIKVSLINRNSDSYNINGCMEVNPEIYKQDSSILSPNCSPYVTKYLPEYLGYDNHFTQNNEDLLEESAGDKREGSKIVYPSNKSRFDGLSESGERLNLNNRLPAEGFMYLNPYKCCHQLLCLYNQCGKLCTVLDERFIVTRVKEAPVLVSFRIEDSLAPRGCMFLWRGNKRLILHELPDGTEVSFDAVVHPKESKFTAIVVWQATKPVVSVEPYFNSYVFIEELQNMEVKILLFQKEGGQVQVVIGGETWVVTFSKSVVYINGKQAQSKADILKLSKVDSQKLLADVSKFVNVDPCGKPTYDFVCTCIWLGYKPFQSSPMTTYSPITLYKKECSKYVKKKQQVYLYCDADVELIINEVGYSLSYKRGDEEISIPCAHKSIFSGDKRLTVAYGGKVKAHISYQISRRGKSKWDVLMVQVPDALLAKPWTECSNTVYRNEVTALEIGTVRASEEECFSHPSLQNGGRPNAAEIVQKYLDLEENKFKLDGLNTTTDGDTTQSNLRATGKVTKSSLGKTTFDMVEKDTVHNIQKVSHLTEKLLMNEPNDQRSLRAPVIKNNSEDVPSEVSFTSPYDCVGDDRDDIKKKLNKIISDKMDSVTEINTVGSYSHSSSESQCWYTREKYPRVLKNWCGKLNWVSDSKVFKIFSELNGKPLEIHVGRNAWLAVNGEGVKAEKMKCDMLVSFDVYFDASLPYGSCIVALWVGEKPYKVVKNNVIYFYDVPGVFCGHDKGDMKFSVCLNDCAATVTTRGNDRVFTTKGKKCTSIPSNSAVILHLRKSKAGGQTLWLAPLIIVQPQQERSSLELKTDIQHNLSTSWPTSHITEDLSGDPSSDSISQSSHNSLMQLHRHASMADLPQYVKNFVGILMLNEHDKIALFSCLGGTALWTSVTQNSVVCLDGRAVEIEEIPLGTGLMFDAFCYDPSQCTYAAVIIWTGHRPTHAEDNDGTKYFYDVKGTYFGVTGDESSYIAELNLDGEIQNVTCQKTGFVILPDGSNGLKKLMYGNKIRVHMKLNTPDNLLVFMFIFIDESAYSSKQPEMCNERKISCKETCVLDDTAVSQTCINLENADILQETLVVKENTVGAESIGTVTKIPVTENFDILRENSYLKAGEWYTTNKNVPYVRDCSGTLVVVGSSKRAIKTFSSKPITININEGQLVSLDNGTAVNILDIPVDSTVQFDAVCDSPEKVSFKPLMMWVGKRPSTLEDGQGNRYLYDVQGVYDGTHCGYFKLLLDLDNHVRVVWVQETEHVYFRNGSKALHAWQAMDRITVHLKEENNGSKLTVLVIIVKSCRHICDTGQNEPVENLEEKDHLTLKTLGLGVGNKNGNWKESRKMTMETVIEKSASVEFCFYVFGGKIETLLSDTYKFTFTHEKDTKTLLIPTDISVDQPRLTQPVMNYYLMTQKKTVGDEIIPHPVCGWFHKRNHKAYVLYFRKVVDYIPQGRLISLSDPTDMSLHHFQCDTEYLFSSTSKTSLENVISHNNVHVVVEDVTPYVILNLPVNRRILFATSNMSLAEASFKFLALSQVENEIYNKRLDEYSDIEIGGRVSEDLLSKKSLGEGNDNSSSVKKSELHLRETGYSEKKDILSGSEVNIHLADQVDELLVNDTNILCGEALRQYITRMSLDAVAMNYPIKYPTLKGNVLQGYTCTTSVFECDGKNIVRGTSDVLHYNCRSFGNHSEKSYLLVRHETDKVTGESIYHPLVLWHGERKGNPYILVNQKITTFDPKSKLLVFGNVQRVSFHYCSYENDCAFTSKSKQNITDFCARAKTKSLSCHVVVEDISPVTLAGCVVTKKIFLISSSLSLAVSSINTFTCNKTEPDVISSDVLCKVHHLLQNYEERRKSASQCKGGYTYHLLCHNFDSEHNLKFFGGCLQFYTEKYALIQCNKKKTLAVCHIANVYFQGRNITSWNEIDRKFWTNFYAVTCPLDEVIMVQDKKLDTMAVVAWSCKGPDVLTIHTCDVHDPTVCVFKNEGAHTPDTEFPEGHSPCALSPSSNNEKIEKISVKELEIVDCLAGSNIFSFHDHILQSCGLERTTGEIKYFNEQLVVFTSELNQMVWCYLSHFYFKGETCNSFEDLIKHRNKKWHLIIVRSPAVVLGGKLIDLKAIVASVESMETLPGIHVCREHRGILLNNITREEFAIAKQIFDDIQKLCEQSEKCAGYLSGKLCDNEMEKEFLSANTVNSTIYAECQGILVSVDDTDPNKGLARVQYQGKPYYVQVEHQTFLGHTRGLLLQAVVGCPLKLILKISMISKLFKNLRVVMAWKEYTCQSVLPPNLTDNFKVCGPSSREEHFCCPRAVEMQHFDVSCKGNLFEILRGKKKESYLESDKVLFKCFYREEELEVLCRKDSLKSTSGSSDNDGIPWSVLVQLPLERDLHMLIQGMGAWKGSRNNVIVQVCDVHRFKLLDVTFLQNCKRDGTSPVTETVPVRVKCNSESVYSKPLDPMSLQVKTNTMNRSDPSINRTQAASPPFKHHSYGSLGFLCAELNCTSLREKCSEVGPTEYNGDCSNEKDMAGTENELKKHPTAVIALPQGSDDSMNKTVMTNRSTENEIQLFSASKTFDETGFELSDVHVAKANMDMNNELINSSVSSDVDIHKNSDMFKQGGSVSYIQSSEFECVDDYQGIIRSAGVTFLVRHPSLYVNLTNPKESLRELIKKEEHMKVEAIIASLVAPISVLGYTTTHEALVAWVGSKPWQVNSTLKHYNVVHGLHEGVREAKDIGFSLEDELCPEQTSEKDKEQRSSLANTQQRSVAQKSIFVLDDKPQTLIGCFFNNCCSEYGTLRSGSGYILFVRKLVYCNRKKIGSKRKLTTALSLKSVNAVIMKLKQAIEVLECQVANIALMVWTGNRPANVEDTIEELLDNYQKYWSVEIQELPQKKITNLSAKTASPKQREDDKTVGVQQELKDLGEVPASETEIWRTKYTEMRVERESDSDVDLSVKNDMLCITSDCRLLLVEDEFAILKAKTLAIVQKKDIYIGGTKILSLYPLSEQLKNIRVMKAYLVRLEKPICIQQYTITDFALIAYVGKKPTVAKDILERWRERLQKVINPGTKTENSVSPRNSQGSTGLKRNRFETSSGKIYKLMKFSGLLEVPSKISEEEKIMVFFQKDCVYVNKKLVPENTSLADHLGPLKDASWGCSARLLPLKKNSSEPRKICGIEVHYIANFVWCGERPSKKDMLTELSDQSKHEQKSQQKAKSHHAEFDPASGNTALSLSSLENDTLVRDSKKEIYKTESVAERLSKQVHNVQEEYSEVHPSTGAKRKMKKIGTSSRSGKEKRDIPKGRVTEVHRLVGRMQLENGDHMYFSREKSFLYGVCLNKVDLWHVLALDMDVNYELTDDMRDVKGVWVGSTSTLDPSSLLSKLKEWCDAHKVPEAAADLLMMEAGGLPSYFNPTIDLSEEKEVIELL